MIPESIGALAYIASPMELFSIHSGTYWIVGTLVTLLFTSPVAGPAIAMAMVLGVTLPMINGKISSPKVLPCTTVGWK